MPSGKQDSGVPRKRIQSSIWESVWSLRLSAMYDSRIRPLLYISLNISIGRPSFKGFHYLCSGAFAPEHFIVNTFVVSRFKGQFRSKLPDQKTTLRLQNRRRSPAQIDGEINQKICLGFKKVCELLCVWEFDMNRP